MNKNDNDDNIERERERERERIISDLVQNVTKQSVQ
ncbi:hypothetical protein GvMRE_I1g690 [endosymbiont GvMRE of Glomus versiforme]|nr:hypothetical protein GvMRE_Ic1g48 [endosymbiont GvMRE of Glomus versiforme]RHZ37754.1 hypothetical protein GvMRE_I1g690 [endosymbiont GvMRE of Glomus versiforme]